MLAIRLGFGFLLIAVAVAPASSAAETPEDPAHTRFGFGSKRGTLSVGYGLGFHRGSNTATGGASRELGRVSLIEVIPEIGIGVTEVLGGEAWYRGNVEIALAAAIVFNTRPRSGVAVGGGATLRYNFLSGKRLVPFLDANAGIVHLDFDLQHQSDGFNFNVGFGGGFHRFMSRRTALTTSIRWQHFSNLGTNLPNDGINAVQFLIGVSYFWE